MLFVAGIIGYKYAMTKYIANETLNELNLHAHDISLNMDKMIEENYIGDIQMTMGSVTRMGYPITARTSPRFIDYFEIFMQNVPSDVCRELLATQLNVPYSIFVGLEEYTTDVNICNQAEEVEMVYEFQKDLLTKEGIEQEDRHETYRCNHNNHCKCGVYNSEQGLCESCPAGEKCVKNFDDARWYVCCEADHVVNGVCCSTMEDGQCCTSQGTCCPIDKPLRDKNGNCHSCDELKGVNVGTNEICSEVCPKRRLMGGYYIVGSNFCSLCGVEGTAVADKPLIMDNSDGTCYGCDAPAVINQQGIYPNYQCTNVCPDREMVMEGSNPRCVLKCIDSEKPLRVSTNSCVSCDTTTAVPISLLNEPCATICQIEKRKMVYVY